MSIQVMTLVWRKSRNRRTALLLLLSIADHAHDDGKGAFPSIETLARKTRQTPRNVQLLLNTLETSGELTVKEGEGPHGCNLYHINLRTLESYPDWEEPEALDEAEAEVEPEPATPEISPLKTFHPENARAENAENFTGGMKNSAPNTRQISPEPSLTLQLTINEPSTNAPFSKTEIQNEIKSLFFVPSDFGWDWLDALSVEIPDQSLHLWTAQRLFSLGRSRAPFDQNAFTRMLRIENARQLAQRAKKSNEAALSPGQRKLPMELTNVH